MLLFTDQRGSPVHPKAVLTTKSAVCDVPAAWPRGGKLKKGGFHAILQRLCAVLAISWGKSAALFVAASWTIMCQNLVWYSKLCQGKIKQDPKWLWTNCYLILVKKHFRKGCSMQVNPHWSKGFVIVGSVWLSSHKNVANLKVDLQGTGTNCANAKQQTLKYIYSLSCNFSVGKKLQVWDSPAHGWGLICHFHYGINWVCVCVCARVSTSSGYVM